jgi:hypothetical protein
MDTVRVRKARPNDRAVRVRRVTSTEEDTMADNSNDPAAAWQAMLGEMGKGFAALANQAMASPEISKVAHQVGDASAGVQKQFAEVMDRYLASQNLPTRAQWAEFNERLAALEKRLDEITSRFDPPER